MLQHQKIKSDDVKAKVTSQNKMNQKIKIATGKACVPTYKIYKKGEFGKMLLQDNRDKNGNKSKNSSNRDPETMKNVNMVHFLWFGFRRFHRSRATRQN